MGMLQSMFDYDKDNIPDAVIASIQGFVEDETCSPDNVKKCSFAGSAFSAWVHAMYKYHFVSKDVEPYRLQLRDKENELGPAMTELDREKTRLSDWTRLNDQLREELNGLGPI